MASTMLQRTQSGTETDSKKATISVWVKLGGSHVGNFNAGIFGTHVSGNYGADGNTQIGFYNGGLYAWFKDGGGTYYKQESTRRFRDHNAWYHLVYRFDMTESTASNRIRVYVNGEEITSWSSTNNPSSTQNIQMNNGGRIVRVGTYNFTGGTNNDFDGCMSHFHFCDGYSYAPTEFGETDSTTGEWKINTSPSVSYGNNGFFILKDGNSVTDQSGNSNNFTVAGGTLTKTEDCPSNVFCTMNSLDNYYSGFSFANGNTTVNLDNISERYVMGNLGVSSGKWYWEGKLVSSSGFTYSKIGIEGSEMKNTTNGYQADSYGYRGENGGKKVNNGTFTNWGNSYTNGDIIGVAVDLDNNYIYFSKNGTWQESGDPTSGSSGTGAAFSLTTPSTGFYYPAIGKEDADTCTWSFNFGNGYFGTTAVASAGTNASGNGIFEYDVPTGYTALSTKGLNE